MTTTPTAQDWVLVPRAKLEIVAGMLESYACCVAAYAKADDLERWDYVPGIEAQAEDLRAFIAASPHPEPAQAAPHATEWPGATTARLHYTNWKGERRVREIAPQYLWYGTTPFHKHPEWLIHAIDVDSGKEKDFALFGFAPEGNGSAAPAVSAVEAACRAMYEAQHGGLNDGPLYEDIPPDGLEHFHDHMRAALNVAFPTLTAQVASLTAERDAYRNAVAGHSERWESAEAQVASLVAENASLKPNERAICGCGKPVEYQLSSGGWACNKWARCTPARVIARLRDERDQCRNAVRIEHNERKSWQNRAEAAEQQLAALQAWQRETCERLGFDCACMDPIMWTPEDLWRQTTDDLLKLSEQLAASEAALREAREDAERWRAFRKAVATVDSDFLDFVENAMDGMEGGSEEQQLDAVVDAARAATKEPK